MKASELMKQLKILKPKKIRLTHNLVKQSNMFMKILDLNKLKSKLWKLALKKLNQKQKKLKSYQIVKRKKERTCF